MKAKIVWNFDLKCGLRSCQLACGSVICYCEMLHVLFCNMFIFMKGLRTEDIWPGMWAGDPKFGAWGWSWYSLQWPVLLLCSLDMMHTCETRGFMLLLATCGLIMQHVGLIHVWLCNMWRCSWNMWIYIWKCKVVWNLWFDLKNFYWMLARIIFNGPGLLFWR